MTHENNRLVLAPPPWVGQPPAGIEEGRSYLIDDRDMSNFPDGTAQVWMWTRGSDWVSIPDRISMSDDMSLPGTAMPQSAIESLREHLDVEEPTAHTATTDDPWALHSSDAFVSSEVSEPTWGVNEIWPENAKGVVAGMDKDGKSTHALELAVSLATGTPMWNLPEYTVAVPAPVLFIQAENSDTIMQRRLQAIFQERRITSAPNLLIAPQRLGVALDLSAYTTGEGYELPGRKKIEQSVKSNGLRYVFLDPLYEMIGSADVSDRTGQVPAILGWLTKLQTMGCSPIITHLTTSNNLTTRDLFGSKFFRHWLEAALLTRRTERAEGVNDFDIRRVAVRDDFGSKPIRLRGSGHGRWEERVASGEKQKQESADKAKLAVQMRQEGKSVSEISDAVAVSERQVKRYLAASKT